MGRGGERKVPGAVGQEKPMSESAPEPVVDPNAWQKALIDRDLGWLQFNRRVLNEALDERVPLLERLKFLAIFTSNLDEFFMMRMGHLARKGAAVRELRTQIRETIIGMLKLREDCFHNVLVPQLAQNGIHLLRWDQLNEEQRKECNEYFEVNISPALTPLALDPGHPFPFLSNLSSSWGFVLRHPDMEERLFVRVKVPTILPHWIPLKSGSSDGVSHYIGHHEVIRQNADKLFPGIEIVSATYFRVSRDGEFEVKDEQEDPLDEMVEKQVRQRKFQPIVRLEISANPDPWTRKLLISKFELDELDVFETSGYMDYTTLFALSNLDRPELRDKAWTPVLPSPLVDEDANIFDVIRAGDMLLHHPYESFDASVERFIRSAADDPHVVAIKLTVYRVGDDTPFVRSLIRAAEAGKQVACLIEVKARFDEARNLHWGEELEKVGVHVVYGVLGLKTHTKVALVVRQEASGLKSYAHIGTGNYHIKTARIYTDMGLLTDDRMITADVVNLFHFLTGRARKPVFQKLLVAPMSMRDRFIKMIDREIEHKRAGRRAVIIGKFNQMEDPLMCQALIRASQAGVPVELIIRGFSTLRPGVPGLTENITIRSVVGRFLEHSRVYYFANGQDHPLDGEFYIGSADWMQRNLSNRVEAIVPIEVRPHREKLWEILEILRQDSRQAWLMQVDGHYHKLHPPEGATGAALVGTHTALMEITRKRADDYEELSDN
jgi:polyphosphate kinase